MQREDYFSLSQLGLPSDVWQPISSGRKSVHCARGQIIYVQDSPAEQFYYIVSGKVRSYISDQDGTERLLTVYHSGNLFGEAAFFDQRPRVSTAVALTDCQLVTIDRQQIKVIISENPEVAMALLKYLARTVRLLSGQLDDLSFLSAEQRLARVLWSAFSASNTIQVTQDELAVSVGVSRVTISRSLSQMATQGVLTTGYRQLTLRDRNALRQLAEG